MSEKGRKGKNKKETALSKSRRANAYNTVTPIQFRSRASGRTSIWNGARLVVRVSGLSIWLPPPSTLSARPLRHPSACHSFYIRARPLVRTVHQSVEYKPISRRKSPVTVHAVMKRSWLQTATLTGLAVAKFLRFFCCQTRPKCRILTDVIISVA